MNRPTGLLALITLATAGWVAACSSDESTAFTEPSLVTQHCVAGGTKDESGPFTFTAPAGQVVTQVCVKAGTSVYVLSPSNPTNGCYTVAFTNGGRTATVTGGGTGPTCKGISYVAFYTGPGPTPSPTPTPTPTPS
jgi:hypothetical protein